MHAPYNDRQTRRGPRVPRALAVSCLALLASLAPALGQQEPPPDGAVDQRQRLTLPAPARNMVLAEMRQMLRSIEGVLSGLAEGDSAAAAEAARASGMAVAVDVAPEVRTKLPAAFVQFGMAATHQGFDALAEKLERSADTQAALADFAALTQNCVACQATYRLDESP